MERVLDAAAVRAWCRTAADDLGGVRDRVDALNVFPVADADTGTNLHLTMAAAADAAAGAGDTPESVWAAASRAALLGARGSSGVILSQLLSGLAGRPPADGPGLAVALHRAADLAYAAVGRPVEGTMLSVARAAAEAAERAAPGSLAETARAAADAARAALDRTPEQLDILAAAGVVDAGAAGVVVVLDALARVCEGDASATPVSLPSPAAVHGAHVAAGANGDRAYEVMYLLDATDEAVAALRPRLAGLGDALVLAGTPDRAANGVGGSSRWHVHVHVDDAGAALEAGLAAGRPHRVRVSHLAGTPGHGAVPATGRAVLAVVPAGAGRPYATAGAGVIEGDASGTAPAAVLVDAVHDAGAGDVVILPNAAGMLAVAGEAAPACRGAGLRVAVIPAGAYPQGLAALAVHDPVRPFEDDLVAMTIAATSARCADLDPSDRGMATAAVDRLLAGGGELVTLVSGSAPAADLATAVETHVRRHAPAVEVACHEGGPPGRLLLGVE